MHLSFQDRLSVEFIKVQYFINYYTVFMKKNFILQKFSFGICAVNNPIHFIIKLYTQVIPEKFFLMNISKVGKIIKLIRFKTAHMPKLNF